MPLSTRTDRASMEAAELPAPLPFDRGETRAHLGTLLVRDGALTSQQLEEALDEKESTGNRLGEIVVERGWVSGTALARALAEQHGLEFLDLARVDVDPAAAGLLPEKFARRYDALPVRFLDEETVLVAVADPTNVLASDDLRLAMGLNVRLAVVEGDDLRRTIARVYRSDVQIDEDGVEEAPEDSAVEDVREGAATSAPAIKLVNQVISRAIEAGASDIHFEP